jgi:RNA polymerase sigma-70 factor (ECF subfamily)
METAKAGSPAAASELADEPRRRIALLYRDRAQSLRRRLRARLGSSDEANDILQDAFARLLGASGVDRIRDPAAFLNRIIRNLLVDRSRRRSARPLHVEIDEAGVAVAPEQGHALELEEVRKLYQELVAALPPRMREVFVLHRVDGLSYRDIAQRLGIGVRTVEWHIAEAITKIGRGLDR